MILKTVGFWLLTCNLVLKATAQNVSGTWQGHFTTSGPCLPRPVRIYLTLIQGSDSLVTGYSTTCLRFAAFTMNGRESGPVRYDTNYCVVAGSLRNNKLEIRETAIIRSTMRMDSTLFQSMIMSWKTNKKQATLKGKWASPGADECNSGAIALKKMN